MKIKQIFAVLILLSVMPVYGQTLIMQTKDADKAYTISSTGPNRSQFSWLEVNVYGTNIVDETEDFRNGFGNRLGISYCKKYKINNSLSQGFGIGYLRETYAFSYDARIDLGQGHFDKGRLILHGIRTDYFWRFNFDPKRGNVVGTFLDLKLFGQFNFSQKQKYKQSKLLEKQSGSPYPERYAAGIRLSFGQKFYAIYAQYKVISEPSKSELPLAKLEMPRFSIGLDFLFALN